MDRSKKGREMVREPKEGLNGLGELWVTHTRTPITRTRLDGGIL